MCVSEVGFFLGSFLMCGIDATSPEDGIYMDVDSPEGGRCDSPEGDRCDSPEGGKGGFVCSAISDVISL